MDRTARLALVCLSLVLLVAPLVAHKPGLPATLKADEAAYYLAALSLVRDGDLRCEPKDLARLFDEYPYGPATNLILATDDGWRTFYYGKPYVLSLLSAPLVAVWGANGMVLFNAVLLVAMVWMAFFYLRRWNDESTAALFAAGFFLLSTTFTYVFWLQPELLNMFATMGCLFFGLAPDDGAAGLRGRARRLWQRLFGGRKALAWSAAILALGVYNKPMLAAIGVPVCVFLLVRRDWRGLAVWLLAAVVATGALAGLSTALTGHPTAYLGVDRQGFNIHTPHQMPKDPEPPPEPGAARELGRQTAGWWWIFRIPEIGLAELAEDFRYFLVGRHVGLFLYQPFSLLALGLFAFYGWRSALRWVILASIAAVALFFLIWISHNWHGGGGFVGNRYFLMVYPAFLFLVTRIRPRWLPVTGYALGGLFLGPLLLAPYGLVVPWPTLQAHVRNHPFDAFPVEHSLREIPGHSGAVHEGVYFWGRKDHVRFEGPELWFHGATRGEVWLQTLEPIAELAFEVTSPVPENPVTLRIGDAVAEIVAGPVPQTVVLRPEAPTVVRTDRSRRDLSQILIFYRYRLEVTSDRGELPRARDELAPFFYLGCALTFLGHEPAPAADVTES